MFFASAEVAAANRTPPFLRQDCRELTKALAENDRALKRNSFPIDRGLFSRGKTDGKSYLSHMGFSRWLERLFSELNDGDVYMDLGPGELNAFVELLQWPEFTAEITLLGVSVEHPHIQRAQENLRWLRKNAKGRFRYLLGKKLEERRPSQLKPVKLATDLFGPLTFTPHIDEVLQIVGDSLEEGGHYIAQYRKVFIIDSEGHRIGRERYLQMIEGMELVDSGWGGILLRKTAEKVRAPRLKLVGFRPFSDSEGRIYPERYYEILIP